MESSSATCSKRSGNEEIDECSPKKAKTNYGNDNQLEETHFSKLFLMILDCIRDLKNVTHNDIEKAIQSMKKSFNVHKFPDVTKWDNLCGYLFRYASHGAGLTRSRVLEALRNCEVFASNLKKPDLKIISLGGGPGNDIIGFCSAMYESQVRSHMSITVVDSVSKWSTCVNLLKIFVTEGDFGNISKLFHQNDVNMSFLEVELPGNQTTNEQYFQLLQETDVIIITKLISILKWSVVENLIKNLYENMKQEAFIVCIDSEDIPSNYFEVLYLSEERDDYMLSVTTEKFNSNDKFKSKARIAILRKRLSP